MQQVFGEVAGPLGIAGEFGDCHMVCEVGQQHVGPALDSPPQSIELLGIASIDRAAVGQQGERSPPGFEVAGWYAVLVPANTPPAVVTRLNTELLAILKLPEVRDRLAADGSEAVGSTPQQLAERIRLEIVKWGKVVRAANIPIEG